MANQGVGEDPATADFEADLALERRMIRQVQHVGHLGGAQVETLGGAAQLHRMAMVVALAPRRVASNPLPQAFRNETFEL